MDKQSKIYIAGIYGMVGSAIKRKLRSDGYVNIIGSSIEELDLSRQTDVEKFMDKEKPDYIFLAAAKVGGIYANNTYPADFIYSNLIIECNIIHSAYKSKAKKLLFLGSSCIYPKFAPQPMKEEYLLSGYLEPTNEPYAVAKIAGIKLCESYNRQYGTSFIYCMPTNLYGPMDNYDSMNSHVIPGLIRRFYEAKVSCDKEVKVWGSGSATREFLYVNDLASACVFLMNNYSENSTINVGYGEEITIKDLSYLIKEIVGFSGDIVFDQSQPDGMPRKMVDSTKIKALGWKPETNLVDGLKCAYQDFFRRYQS